MIVIFTSVNLFLIWNIDDMIETQIYNSIDMYPVNCITSIW